MATTKKLLREGYEQLKKAFEKMIRQNKQQADPQFALQPIRNRPHRFPGADREAT